MTRYGCKTLLLMLSFAVAFGAEQQGVMRGVFIFGHGANRFEPCGAGKKYWVADSLVAQRLRTSYQATAQNPEEPVYVELRGLIGPKPQSGAAASHDGVLVIHEVVAVRAKGAGNCSGAPAATKKK